MNNIRNESRINLAELLAAIAIAAIIIILIVSVFVTFNKQYNKQSDEIRDLTNVSTAAQAITKNIRSAIDVEIKEDNDSITIIQPEQTITYALVNDNIEKDNNVYLQQIEMFYVAKEDDIVTLKIYDSATQKMKTTIVLRKDGEIGRAHV